MFKMNFKIALRNLWKNKLFTLINAGGLAIGLASCMILLLYVAYEWGYDRSFTDYEHTYVIGNNQQMSDQVFTNVWTPGVMAAELRETLPGVKYASRSTYPGRQLISNGRNGYKKQVVFAEPSFLKMLDYKFLSGNREKALTSVNGVILTASLAKTLFGDENPLNKSLKLDNSWPLTVEGVIEDVPANSSIQFDYLLSWTLNEKVNPYMTNQDWGNNFCLTMVQLTGKDAFDRADGYMKSIFQHHGFDAGEATAFLHPLSKWHLYDEFENGKLVGGKIDQVKIFLLLAFCILLIACVNFMNLSTARSEKRAKEVGVRKAIGSSRTALVSQFMMESMLLSFIGMIVAFMLMELSLPYFNNLFGIGLGIEYLNWKFWGTLIGLSVFTGLLAGSYPAFYLSSFEPVKVLKGFGINTGASLSVRKLLVVFQFVFAACLIVCTSVVYQQLNYIKNKPIGYDKGNLIQVTVEGRLRDQHNLDLLKDQLLKSGAAKNVSYFSRDISEGGNNTSSVDWPGKAPKTSILFNYRLAGYDFVKTIGTQLVAGREFSAAYADTAGIIVNEAAVKVMGLKNPIGAVIKRNDQPLTIVGVIKDFVMESAYKRTTPMLVYPHDINEVNVLLVRLDPAQNISSSLAKIDEIVKTVNPDYPVERTFVDESFAAKFRNERLLGTLSNWFGGFAIFISCLGLLGLALFMAEQRKKEISIRKVLGASTSNILVLLNKDFIRLVAIANLIAFPIAYVIINKWLSAYEFRVSISILPFAVAAFLSLLIAILTVTVQSVKVAKANPVDALKYE